MTSSTATDALIVKRVIAASPEALFDAWTDPAALAVWMVPGDGTHTDAVADPRVGGEFTLTMHSPSSSVLHRGTYLVIDRPRRLSFTWQSRYTGDLETVVTIDFTALESGTEVAITHTGLPTLEAVDDHSGGWDDCLVELDEHYGEGS
jgi:uncharacterized protein YndB with AHSA1/START domain